MKKIILFILSVCISLSAIAQTPMDSVAINNKFNAIDADIKGLFQLVNDKKAGDTVTPKENGIAAQKDIEANTPVNSLAYFLLAALLGTAGQVMRIIVGIKKQSESSENFDVKRLSVSLLLAVAVGMVAGILYMMANSNVVIGNTMYLACLSAGYAGTDFIEGWMRKNQSLVPQNQQLGIIAIKIADYANYQDITYSIDNNADKKPVTTDVFIIDALTIGSHDIKLSAKNSAGALIEKADKLTIAAGVNPTKEMKIS